MPAVFDSGSTFLRLFSELSIRPKPVLFVPDALGQNLEQSGNDIRTAGCDLPVEAKAAIQKTRPTPGMPLPKETKNDLAMWR
jgi:hypothetical protein